MKQKKDISDDVLATSDVVKKLIESRISHSAYVVAKNMSKDKKWLLISKMTHKKLDGINNKTYAMRKNSV